jgi:hypothetical protein
VPHLEETFAGVGGSSAIKPLPAAPRGHDE